MFVTYGLNGESLGFEIEDAEDTRELLLETVRKLRERHDHLGQDASLVPVVADRMLNGLADDSETIDLGNIS